MTFPGKALGRLGWISIVSSQLLSTTMNTAFANSRSSDLSVEQRIESLIAQMTLIEKIGQMSQVNAGDGDPVQDLGDAIRQRTAAHRRGREPTRHSLAGWPRRDPWIPNGYADTDRASGNMES